MRLTLAYLAFTGSSCRAFTPQILQRSAIAHSDIAHRTVGGSNRGHKRCTSLRRSVSADTLVSKGVDESQINKPSVVEAKSILERRLPLAWSVSLALGLFVANCVADLCLGASTPMPEIIGRLFVMNCIVELAVRSVAPEN